MNTQTSLTQLETELVNEIRSSVEEGNEYIFLDELNVDTKIFCGVLSSLEQKKIVSVDQYWKGNGKKQQFGLINLLID